MHIPHVKKTFAALAMLLLAGGLMAGLTACDQSTTTASCAFVVGNGQSNTDAKLHRVIYPGSTVNVDTTTENVWYVPCNSRNYIINSGTQKDANGQVVGDRHQPIQATTKTGVPILISARALWTLNEDKTALSDFWAVCFKYTCASDKDQGGGTDFATKGWNGMLGENFSPTMDTIGRMASVQVDDSIWQSHNPAQYKALGDAMSQDFADVMRANLGYPQDLFCGSGNSGWQNPNNPGAGKFTCTPVRIVVDDVERASISAGDTSTGAQVVNQQRLANAKILYGDAASYWLGVMDAIDECHKSGTTCYIYLGNAPGAPTSSGTSK